MNTLYFSFLLFMFLGSGGWGNGGHGHITGDEIAGIGAGLAAVIGVVGYLILRRRNSSSE